MSWTASNPVSIGEATKKSHYDNLWDNADYLKDYVKGDNGEGSGASGHIHDDTNGLKVLFTDLDFTSSNLTSIATRNFSDMTGYLHAANHTNATDDIQNVSTTQKGLMTSTLGNDYQCSLHSTFNAVLTLADTYYSASNARFPGYIIVFLVIAGDTANPISYTHFNSQDSLGRTRKIMIYGTYETVRTITDNSGNEFTITVKTLNSKIYIKSNLANKSVYGFAWGDGNAEDLIL